MLLMIYGYTRTSTHKQNIERQHRNILAKYPTAKLYSDVFTGSTLRRPEWEKLLKRLKSGDAIVFDSVSRMSRDAAEGFAMYKRLYEQGITLVFFERTAY